MKIPTFEITKSYLIHVAYPGESIIFVGRCVDVTEPWVTIDHCSDLRTAYGIVGVINDPSKALYERESIYPAKHRISIQLSRITLLMRWPHPLPSNDSIRETAEETGK